MKKHIFALITIVVFMIFGNQAVCQIDIGELWEIHDAVRTLYVEDLSISYASDPSDKNMSKTWVDFAPTGTQTHRVYVSLNADGTPSGKTESSFDVYGNVVQSTQYSAEGELRNTFKTTYQYNDEGKMVERIRYRRDGSLQDRAIFLYNVQDRRTKDILKQLDGKFERLHIQNEDKQGNLVEYVMYSANGILDYKEWRTELSDGYRQTKIWYSDDGEIINWHEYTYNSAGLQISWRIYDKNDSLKRECLYHSEEGKVRQEDCTKYDEQGVLTQVAISQYDEWENVTTTITYTANNRIQSEYVSEYRYDARGNWTQRIEEKRTQRYEGMIPDWRRERIRTITYHPAESSSQ
jgi:YD repeat-containing protein